FVNRSAKRALLLGDNVTQVYFGDEIPEFIPLFESLQTGVHDVAKAEIKLVRNGKQENLLVRIATRENAEGAREGFVIAFEDVTDLVSAQRMAAWGDVARRIAHEIKNPLTPIKLSAERLRRKFAPKLGDDAEQLENLTHVIVRQTDDLRRIVDDFSRFARMPEPQQKSLDLGELLRGVMLLQEMAHPDVRLTLDAGDAPIMANVDQTLIGQALTNVLKNACEAIEERLKTLPTPDGEIRISLQADGAAVRLTVSDNGIGLPHDRAKLFEPYVTHRDGGTGLGLPIVQKIIEDHGGSLQLKDAEPFAPGQPRGAMAEIILPLVANQTHATSAKEVRYG
ncbi:MAG: ATP-binding protein, partial [Pseudomonadota bacterium]